MDLAHLDWTLWRTFLAIHRTGSLSGAARTLGVAHPTVRRHLDELEARLGAALFVRSPSGLIANDMAARLLEAAQSMEAAALSLVRTASADVEAVAGVVRITASEVMGAEVLPPMLAALMSRHPELVFELTLTNQVENLLRRDADIAVRMTAPTQGDLYARRVGDLKLGLYAHTDWLARHTLPLTLQDAIGSGALIGYDRDPSLIHALRNLGIEADRNTFGFRSDSDLAQLAALRAGLGIGVSPHIIATLHPGLNRILPDFEHRLEVWLVAHRDVRGLARVRAVLDEMALRLAAVLSDSPRFAQAAHCVDTPTPRP